MPTPLTRHLAARIVDHIREERLPCGARLVERALAEQLRVSRSPVRGALKLLADDGVVVPAPSGGYEVRQAGEQLTLPGPDEGDDDVYFRIAGDRLDGELPEKVTESALARRYDLAPAQLSQLLRRITAEGWIERLPGYGWEFQPALTSLQSYEDSYRFRLALEPAAILEPGFVLDRDAVEEAKAQQQRLVDGDIWSVSNATLFDLNSHFHETVMECSHNTFFIDGLKRVDTLRRLIEYRQSLGRERAIIRCREHVELAVLLLDGNQEDAAAFMRRHLSTVSGEKIHRS